MPDFEKQVEQLTAVIASKDAEIAGKVEQIKELGGYKQQAATLQEQLDASTVRESLLEAQMNALKSEVGAAKSAAVTATGKGASDAKKVAAAQAVADGLKVLFGS